MSNIRKANRASKTKQSTNASKNKAYLGQHDTVSGQVLQNESITNDKIKDNTISTSKMADIGAIGDIKSSLLDEAAFIAIHGSGWVSAVGQDVTGSKYHELTNRTVLPDMRGRFLRGVGSTNGYVSPGLGLLQGDSTTRPKFSTFRGLTSNPGNHTHGYVGPAVWYAVSTSWPFTTSAYNSNTGYAGNHYHTVTVNSGGDPETRPINIGVNFFIRVD